MPQIDDLAISLCAAVAEEIRDIQTLVETLADVLAADEHLACNYLEQLQMFDLLVQRSQAAAELLDSVVTGSCLHSAVEGVRLNLVQDRMRMAIGAN